MSEAMVSYRRSSQRRNKRPVEEVASDEDLLTEILKRLPTKKLLRLKLVSKQWLSLISTSHFSISHTRFLHNQHLLKPSAIFIDVIYRQPPSTFIHLPLNPAHIKRRLPPLDFINDAPDLKVMQSCTGLLICASGFGNPTYLICNPATKKSKAVTFPRPPALDYELVGVNLAFDPMKSHYYKIISVWQDVLVERDDENNCVRSMSRDFSMDIYSSETDTWSVSRIKFCSTQDIKFDHAAFLNGVIHWDSLGSESLYLELESERLLAISMPKQRRRYNNGLRYFGVSGGRLLHVAMAGRKPGGFHLVLFRIYEMLEDRSTWYIKYRIDLEDAMYPRNLYGLNYPNGWKLIWFAVHSDEEQGDSLITLSKGGLTIKYDFKDGRYLIKSPKLWRQNKYDQLDYYRFRGCLYFETLSFV